MNRRSIALALILLSSVAWSAPPRPASRAFDVPAFCSAVDAQILADEDMASRHPSILYIYQAMLFEAAGVKPSDSDDVAFAKSRAFLDAHAALTCTTPNFVPAHGNVYKLAVARQSVFIDDALDRWHVDLNRLDAIDGKTVLDYISDRRKAAGSSSWGSKLAIYYRRFRAAGALHAAELEAIQRP